MCKKALLSEILKCFTVIIMVGLITLMPFTQTTVQANTPGTVTIPAGQTITFITTQAAGADVTFPEGDWSVVIKTDSDWSAFCSIAIGENTPPGGSIVIGNVPASLMTIKVHSNSFTIHKGNYLGVKITNKDSIDHTCYADGSSCLILPTGAPGYPLPELAAGILFTMGLACLGCWVLIGRKRESHLNVDI